MPRTTRTTATRPFGDLSPTQFEAVVRQVLGNLDGVIWEAKPDPIGHLGSDDGQDVRAVELSPGPKRTTKRPWLVQVKRYKEIHPQDLRDIVDAAIPAGSKARGQRHGQLDEGVGRRRHAHAWHCPAATAL